jgi:hypothetical protein
MHVAIMIIELGNDCEKRNLSLLEENTKHYWWRHKG